MAKEKNAELPRPDELGMLPRWARLAFAARSAKRVEPLFLTHVARLKRSEDDRNEVFKAIHKLNSLPQVAASSGSMLMLTEEIRDAGRITGEAARHGAAEIAVRAAHSAAALAAQIPDALLVYSTAAYASNAAAAFAEEASTADTKEKVIRAMRRDFELLTRMAKKQKWTDDSPVDPDLCGPLWSDGEPEGWPSSGPHTLPREHFLYGTPPQRSQAALAARAMRRIEPLLRLRWPQIPADDLRRVDRWIRVVEDYAQGRTPDAAAMREAEDPTSTILTRALTASSCAHMVITVAKWCVAILRSPDQMTPEVLRHTIHAVECAGGELAVSWVDAVRGAQAWDAKVLAAQAILDGETAEWTPNPDRLGPLWPEGVPEGWPKAPSEPPVPAARPAPPDRLELRIRVPAKASDAEIKRIIKEHMLAASALHAAHGGSGLEPDTIEVYEAVLVPTGGGVMP